MGQKVHPHGFRLGYTKGWTSRWFSKHGYAGLVLEDLKLKEGLRKRLKPAGISSIHVDRPGNKLRITIRTARPGIIIGRRGSEIEKLKAELQAKTDREVYIDIQEVHRPELDSQLVSESVAIQIEKRVAFRRAMRKAVDSALRFGCLGIKIRVGGRLNGAEIARVERYLQGRMPLATLRADIQYGFSEANTTYGVIGVQCWVYRGDILDAAGQARALSGQPQDDLEPARRREARSAGDRSRERARGGARTEREGGGQRGPQQARPTQQQPTPPPEPIAPVHGTSPIRPPLAADQGGPVAPPVQAAPVRPAAEQAPAEQPAAGTEGEPAKDES